MPPGGGSQKLKWKGAFSKVWASLLNAYCIPALCSTVMYIPSSTGFFPNISCLISFNSHTLHAKLAGHHHGTDEETEAQKVKPVTSSRSHNEDTAELEFQLPKPHVPLYITDLTGLLSPGPACLQIPALPCPCSVTLAELPFCDSVVSLQNEGNSRTCFTEPLHGF